ncbi:MAG: molybdopterin-dependent oxidoreductase, partial [Gemmataceae bacterium]
WVEKHVQGWPLIRRKLSDFPLERVESETGIDQSAILELARLYGTIRPGLIKIADGINRNFHGGQNVRALCLLPALTGQFGTPGGGFSYSTSGYISWEKESVHKWSECPEPGRSINMNRLGESLLGEARDPEIKSLFVFGANPATSSPNAGKITKGLRREDLFTIVHEIFLTDTALHADFVLPATTQLEQTDLHKAYGHTCLTYNAQAIPPRGESKSNWEVMGLLAKAMGFQEAWLHQSPDEVIDEVLKATAAINPFLKGIDLDQLREKGHASLNLGDSLPFSGGIFPTPSGKIDFETPIPGSDGTPQIFGDFPPRKDRGEMPLSELDKGYHFVTAASHHFVTSTFANHPQMKKNARADFIEINPSDAAGKDIEEGDMVEVYNGRGSCRLRARLTDNVRTGTVASPKGNWSSLLKGNNVNWLTTDELGDMGGQSCFHSTRVWLKRLSRGRDQK